MNTLKKCLMFTDIHFGRSNNSELHNLDCLNFIKWICSEIKKDNSIDHIMFLGDWHEQRSSINGATLSYSYESAKLLNNLNIPIYFITGNHDLYYRNTRDISTTLFFESFKNFILIDKDVKILETEHSKILICPFLFEHEYKDLLKYSDIPIYFMHAEFKGFIVTGETKELDHGPDHKLFKNQKRIFSGHFHKRQNKDNIFYIGSTFPMNYSDANDVERGYALYTYQSDDLRFKNWKECPSYIKCVLSDLLTDYKTILRKFAHVKCLVDIEISSEESSILKDKFIKEFNLRELSFEEKPDEILMEDDIDLSGFELESTEVLIEEMLKKVKSDKIDNTILIKRYKEI